MTERLSGCEAEPTLSQPSRRVKTFWATEQLDKPGILTVELPPPVTNTSCLLPSFDRPSECVNRLMGSHSTPQCMLGCWGQFNQPAVVITQLFSSHLDVTNTWCLEPVAPSLDHFLSTMIELCTGFSETRNWEKRGKHVLEEAGTWGKAFLELLLFYGIPTWAQLQTMLALKVTVISSSPLCY